MWRNTMLMGLMWVLGLGVPTAHAKSPQGTSSVRKAGGSKRLGRGQIRKALRLPHRSTSIGSTSWGKLHRARRLPLRGRHHRFFAHIKDRATFYGTQELARLIREVARRVAREFRGSVLRLGNAGFRSGTKIPWSISHQSGRDIDLAIFALDKKGRSAKLTDFVKFNRTGRAQGGKLRFDVKRNLSLVRALVMNRTATVQWIFIYRPLKNILLAHAEKTGVAKEVIERLRAVLRQPSDSAPHRDHFHVRLYCSAQDRLHGCLDRSPFHAWHDRADALFEKRVELLERIARHPAAGTRREAMAKLVDLRAAKATATFVRGLTDSSRGVRRAAWQGLKLVGTVTDVPGILKVLKTTRQAKRAADIFVLLSHIRATELVKIALELLADPNALLHPDVVKRGLRPFKISAIDILQEQGRKEAAQAVRPSLEASDKAVRKRAHLALRHMTNQPIKGRMDTRHKKRRQRIVAAWDDFFDKQGDESWFQWLRLGFEARGLVFKRKMLHATSVPTLIKAIRHREDVVSINALRVLGEITGHHIAPKARTKRNSQRHWTYWWRDHKDRFAQSP